MLRAFWKLSFIKIGDKENKAHVDVILKNNEKGLVHQEDVSKESKTVYHRIQKMARENYQVNSDNIVSACSGG